MSLLSGFLSRLRGLFGGGSDDAAADADETDGVAPGDAAADEAAGPVCSVCGTRADPGAEACPLCGSTDLRTAGDEDPAGSGSTSATEASTGQTVREASSPPDEGGLSAASTDDAAASPGDEASSGLAPDRARQTRVDARTDDDAVDQLKRLTDERRTAEASDDENAGADGGDDPATGPEASDAAPGSECGDGSG